MMLTAVGLGCASVVIGLLLSWHLGTAAGATVAAVAVAVFFAVLLLRDVTDRAARSRRRTEASDGGA